MMMHADFCVKWSFCLYKTLYVPKIAVVSKKCTKYKT
jgi:hypothetical protein